MVARQTLDNKPFSGRGGLDLDCLPCCAPVAYYDICPFAASVLRTKMRDGNLSASPLRHEGNVITTSCEGANVAKPLDETPSVFVGALGSGPSMPMANNVLGLACGFP